MNDGAGSALAFSDDDKGSAGDGLLSAAGFAVPGSKKTAPGNEPAGSSPPQTGALLQAAGFKLPGSPQSAEMPIGTSRQPTWQEKEADANLEALGIPMTAPTAPPQHTGPGRGIKQAIIDKIASIPEGILESFKYPGDVMQGNKPVTIGDTLGLAGMIQGGGIGRTATNAAVAKVGTSAQAVNKLVEAIGPENVPAVVERLQANPRLTVADASDPVRTIVAGFDLDAAKDTFTIPYRGSDTPAWSPSRFSDAGAEFVASIADDLRRARLTLS